MPNPFADIVSVEVREPYETVRTEAGAVKDRYQPGDIVEVTIRVPEQFFTETYMKADWDAAMAAVEAQKNTHESEDLPREVLWALPGYLTENFRNDIDVEQELYGPDGQQVALW